MMCPKCGISLEKGVCLKCGFMENGNVIHRYNNSDKYTSFRIYNEDFDNMNQNFYKFLIFILGPFYFSYRNHLFFGFFIGLIDLLFSSFVLEVIDSLNFLGNIYSLYAFFLTVFYPIVNRALYMGFSNSICIKLDGIGIKKLEKYDNYMDLLVNHKCRSFGKLIIHVLLYVVLFLSFANLGLHF